MFVVVTSTIYKRSIIPYSILVILSLNEMKY